MSLANKIFRKKKKKKIQKNKKKKKKKFNWFDLSLESNDGLWPNFKNCIIRIIKRIDQILVTSRSPH